VEASNINSSLQKIRKHRQKCKNKKGSSDDDIPEVHIFKNVVQELECPEDPQFINEGYHQKNTHTRYHSPPPVSHIHAENENYDMNSCRIT
jgi:hypothetical protein